MFSVKVTQRGPTIARLFCAAGCLSSVRARGCLPWMWTDHLPSAGESGAGTATWDSNNRLARQMALVIVSLLVCAASVAVYRRFVAGRLTHGVRLYR